MFKKYTGLLARSSNFMWLRTLFKRREIQKDPAHSVGRDQDHTVDFSKTVPKEDFLRKLQEAEFQKQALDEHAIVSIADIYGNIIHANDKFCEMSGYSREELLGQNHRMLKSGEHSAEFYADLWRTITKGRTWHGEIKNAKKNGDFYWVRATIVPFMDSDGKPFQYIAVRTDITEQRTLQNQLSAAISAMPDGFIYFDKDDKFVVCNEPYKSAYTKIDDLIKPGMTFEAMLRGSVERGEITDAIGNEEAWLQHRLEMHRNPKGSFEQILGDGRHLVITEYKTAEGGSVGIRRDITARVEAEQAVINSKSLLQDAIESLGDAFILFDSDDRLVVANSKYKEFYQGIEELVVPGVKFEELIRVSVFRGMYADAEGREAEWIAQRLESHNRGDTVFEQQLSDGRWLRILERRTSGGGIAGSRVDITELKQAQEIAEQASAAKSDFLSSMSHELRTPMNAILGFAQLLDFNRDEPLSETQKISVGHIMKGGNHLLYLIDQVLDLAKIESGKLEVSIEKIGLDEICTECLTLIAHTAADNGVEIDEYKDISVNIEADYSRFKQVLLNLLSNAVKYNFDGGNVTLKSSKRANNIVRISVSDTGVGIAEDAQEGLFEPFYRAGREGSEIEGTGIGLTITRQLVEAMNGHIGFESEFGKGSCFWVDFPMIEDAGDVRTEERKKPVEDEKAAQTAETATVLYIEDNPANQQLMAAILDKMGGMTMISAHNAEHGISMARQQNPDLILLDINLPGMNGIAAAKALRKIEAIGDTPIIGISAAAMHKDVAQAMEAGFTGYVTKPFNIQKIIDEINKVLCN